MDFQVDPKSGLITGARVVACPNHDTRPDGLEIDALVIHCISLPPGTFGGADIENLFCNRLDPSKHPFYREIHDLKVSAHLLIRRDGETVQFVPLHLRAWHAGESYCEGRTRVNDFSIGIELEGSETQGYEPCQYSRLLAGSGVLENLRPHLAAGP